MGTDDLARELEAFDARLNVLADSAHPDEQAEFDRLVAKRTDVSDKLRRHEELRRSADIPGRQELPYGTGPTVLKRGPADPWNARGETRDLARYAAEQLPIPEEGRDKILRLIESEPVTSIGAAWALRCSHPDYRSAFRKLLRDPMNGHRLFTASELDAYRAVEEIRGMVVGTNTAGGFLVRRISTRRSS